MTQSPPKKTNFRLRPIKTNDVPFVMSSWMNSMRSVFKFLDTDLFSPAYREQVTRILKKAQVRVCVTDNDDEIIGYSVSYDAQKVLHWVYVKEGHRGKGVAKMLIEHLGESPRITLSTPHAREKLRLGRVVAPAFLDNETAR